MQKEAEEKSLFEDIQKSDKINELAEILVSKRKIEPPEIDRAEAISDLSSILKVMEHFDLIKAQNLLNRYYALMNYSKQLTEFMISEELTQNQVLFDFENVLKIMEKHLEADIIQQLKIMTEKVVISENKLYQKWSNDFQQINMAIVVAFLCKIRDNNRSRACHDVLDYDIAVRILYQQVRLNETRIGKENVSLTEVIEGVTNNEYKDYDYLYEFKTSLSHGVLVTSLSRANLSLNSGN